MTHPTPPIMSNNGMRMRIRPARVEEAPALAALAWAAKAAWGYTPAQMEAWREDLSPCATSIAAQPTWVAELDGELAGFCQLNLQARPAELEHLWVRPQFMRHGIGRALLACALHELAVSGVDVLHIDADPHAEPFYLACGAVRVGALAAPVEGEPGRVRPQMRLSTADRIAATGDTRLRQEPR